MCPKHNGHSALHWRLLKAVEMLRYKYMCHELELSCCWLSVRRLCPDVIIRSPLVWYNIVYGIVRLCVSPDATTLIWSTLCWCSTRCGAWVCITVEWVAVTGRGSVHVTLNAEGPVPRVYHHRGEIRVCVVNSAHSLLVADTGNNQLQLYESSAQWNIVKLRPLSSVKEPRGAAVIGDRLYVVSRNRNTVSLFTTYG